MNDDQKSRAEFELIYSINFPTMPEHFFRSPNGDYIRENVQAAWIIWSAALKFNASSSPFVQEITRIEDMSSKGFLKIMRDGDGDVIVAVHGMRGDKIATCEAVEFCVGRGGCRSPRTVAALINLAAAMQADNENSPIINMDK